MLKLLLIPVIVVVLIISMVVGYLKYLISLFRGKSKQAYQQAQGNRNRREGKTSIHTEGVVQQKKVIGKDEGEYVDYEEVEETQE